ncbi:MAG TPA: (2Fe-2S)-binding protein [Rhizobiaceae bacterium]
MRNARLIPGIAPGTAVSFTFNGQTVDGYVGEGVAAALMRAGIRGTRTTARQPEPRGYYCGMGVCWECTVEVEGMGTVRGCMFPVQEGLVVRSPSVRSEEDL